jgi:hypothetical protein
LYDSHPISNTLRYLTRDQNIFADFYILILPISTVWNLQMSTRRKIAVLSVVAFGSSAVIIACFRLIPLFQLNSSTDVSWVLGIMIIVAALEIQFAVIAVNLPSLKALWMRYTGGSSSGSGQGHSNSGGYKLSSMGRNGASTSTRGRWGKNVKSKGSRGSITRLEGLSNTESEEELCRQGSTSVQLPIQGKKDDFGPITVTTNVDVKTTTKTKDEDAPSYHLGSL